MAIVSRINRELYIASTEGVDSRIIEEAFQRKSRLKGITVQPIDTGVTHVIPLTRMPRPGAVILALDETHLTPLGYNQTKELIDGKCSPPDLKNNFLTNEQTDDSHAESYSTSPKEENSYTITFLEAESSQWSCVDAVDITVSGITLTLIDDINGRDMPILRGALKTIDIHLERGLGIKTNVINATAPTILSPVINKKSSPEVLNNGLVPFQIRKGSSGDLLPRTTDLSEIVLKVKSDARIGLEYYNARIAQWEHLIEPHQFQIYFELQKGNPMLPIPRPGNIALSLSDGILNAD
eukprot:15182467-Ditylum_brightwellii.AAC.1